MRRPLFFIFIFVFFISFLNIKDQEDFINKTNIQIQGIIKHDRLSIQVQHFIFMLH